MAPGPRPNWSAVCSRRTKSLEWLMPLAPADQHPVGGGLEGEAQAEEPVERGVRGAPAVEPEHELGPCREFRVRSGMIGAKEPRHATTQRAEDTRRHSRPAAGRRRSEDGLRPERPARRAEEGARRTGVERRDGPPPQR